MIAAAKRGRHVDASARRRPRDAARMWTIRETGARRPRFARCPSEPGSDGRAGKTRRSIRCASATICANSRRWSTATATSTLALRSFRRRLRARAHQLRSAQRRRASRTWRAFLREAARTGGRVTAARCRASTATARRKAEFLPIMYGPELMQAFREFKAIWDRAGRMNPGKVVDAALSRRRESAPGARLPAGHARKRASTFRSDEGDGFARAIERCIGMGKCRSAEGGDHVPELSRDARRALLDARPRASALGNAAAAT